MSSAAMARCPKCLTVAEGDRISEVMNRLGFIGRGRRLTCAGCGTRLAIRSAQANAAWVVLLAAVVLLLPWVSRLPNEAARAVTIVAVLLFAFFVHYRLARRLVRLELPAFGEEDRTPLAVEMMRVGTETAAAEAPVPPLEAPAGPPVPWRCSSCREQNPERFEICWKCGTAWNQRT
jgi:hypothetical protein